MFLRKLYRKLRRLAGITLRVRWLKTIYLNLRLLPVRQAVHLPFVVTGKVHFRKLTGKVDFQCPAAFGTVIVGKDVDNMPVSYLPAQLFIQGTLVIKGACIINQGANVVVWPCATMELGEGTLICSGVLLKAVRSVTIGKYAMISSGCFIMDSDIHCIRDTETGEVNNPTRSIRIGDYCWLSMNTSVLAGGGVPDRCITARYAHISREYGGECAGSLLAGMPARIVRKNKQRVVLFEREAEIKQYFTDNPQVDSMQYLKIEGIEEVSKEDMKAFFSV